MRTEACSCPTCGQRATRTVMSVSRPGQALTEEEVIECWREPRHGSPYCPPLRRVLEPA